MENNENTDAVVSQITSLLEGLSRARLALRDEADAIAQEYWDHHFANNPRLSLADKTPMGVRVIRQTNNPLHFTITWFWNKWVLTKTGKKQIISNYIPKGRTKLTYPRKRLIERAKDWESDLILELEDRFALVRRDVRDIGKSEAALKRLLNNRAADAQKAAQAEDDEQV